MIKNIFKIGFLCLSFIGQPMLAMDRGFSSFIDYWQVIFSGAPAPDGFLSTAVEAFGVEEKDVFQKIIFGYFVDPYAPVNEEEARAIEELSYGYFPGSISAQIFINELERFIKSNDALSLNMPSIEQLKSFIAAVKKGQWQGTAIDTIRAQKPLLAFTSKLGINFLNAPKKSDFDKNGKQILEAAIALQEEALAKNWLLQILDMKEGEPAIFLTGDVIHDTRLRIDRLPEGWLFTHYDSAEPLSTSALIPKEKLQQKTSSYIASKLRQTICGCCPEKFRFFNLQTLASIPIQTKPSCHIRGLIAAFKDWFIRGKMPAGIALEQWHKLEYLFGAFLLNDKRIEDKQLLYFSQKQLKVFNDEYLAILELKKVADSEKADDALMSYNACLRNFKYVETNYKNIDDNLAKIILNHRAFIELSEAFLLNGEMLDLLAFHYPNIPPLTFDKAKERKLKKQFLSLPFLENQIKECQTEFEQEYCHARKSIANFYGRDYLQQSCASFVAVEKDNFEKFLLDLQQNKNLHIDPEYRRNVVKFLGQAMQNMRFIELEQIINNLKKENSEQLLMSLYMWMGSGQFTLLPGWVDAAILYVKNNPNSQIRQAIFFGIANIFDHSKTQIAFVSDDQEARYAELNKVFEMTLPAEDFHYFAHGENLEILLCNNELFDALKDFIPNVKRLEVD